MIAGCIFAGIAGVTTWTAMHYRKKWKDLKGAYNKRCEELTDALGEVGRVKLDNESIREANKSLAESIHNYKHLTTTGGRNLKVKEYIIPDIPELPKYSIAVVGQSTRNPELEFVLKAFTADNEEDREFAIREAEELIETIQKA